MTARAMNAAAMDSTGAARNAHLLAAAGITSSLNISLIASAHGWSSPNGPTRFGPSRNCMNASVRRSIKVM